MKSPLRVRLAALVVALVALIGIFADVVASDAPLVARHRGRWLVLPAVTAPRAWAEVAPDEVSLAVWAPLRASPRLEHTPSRATVLAATVHGARTTLVTTLGVLLVALTLGVALGAAAGGGGLADSLLSRAVELSGAVPALVLLALLRASQVGPSWLAVIGVLGALRAVEVARLVRGEVLRVGGSDFVLAARALGSSPFRVSLNHILPHVWGTVSVNAAFTVAAVVALEAALGFMGLGLPSEVPSWGGQLAAWGLTGGWGAVVAVVVTTGCSYVVADALDDRLSARRGSPSRV